MVAVQEKLKEKKEENYLLIKKKEKTFLHYINIR